MVNSQNGWRANDRAVVASFDLPGGKVALHAGSAGQILAWCARRWHTEVEPLVWPGCWGYAERDVRGSTDVSNHASGTALDLNAPAHPLGTAPAANFTPGKIAAIHRILADTGGLIRWGGDYTGRKDGMHLEVNDGVSPAQLDALWARLQGRPVAAAPPAGGGPLATLQRGMSNDPRVAALQRFIHEHEWHPPIDVPVTGNYLDQTVAAVRAAQAQVGVTGADADGTIVGPRTSAAFRVLGASW